VSRVRGNSRAVCWKKKREVYALSKMNIPPAEGNVREDGIAVKPLIIEDSTTHMGYVDLSDKMANSYSINRKSWKCTKKLFFHQLDLTILNSYIDC
jgi:hypothetical protein